jgi:hypothetical protein
LAVGSPYGVVVVGRGGTVIGADGLVPRGGLAHPAFARGHVVCARSMPLSRAGDPEGLRSVEISVLELPSARLVSTGRLAVPDEVTDVAVIRGAIVVSAGESTVVVEAGAGAGGGAGAGTGAD